MHYDYSKLQQPAVLDLVELHFNTREISVMTGEKLDTIILGNGVLFLVENGTLSYYSGLFKPHTLHELEHLTKIMRKLQSVITLECPAFTN